VNLRGLIIEGAGVGQNGIQFNTGKALTIDNCVIRNMDEQGIRFLPATNSSLAVSNTFISANGAMRRRRGQDGSAETRHQHA
jgi:hypothetical protein